MFDGIVHHFTGLWPIIKANGEASGIILGLLAAAYFIPWTMPRLKAAALVGAGVITATTLAFNVGVSMGEDRKQAQWDAAEKRAEQGRKDRDELQADVAGDDDDARLASILKSTKTNQERFDAFKAELAQRQGGACRLSADDVASLRLEGAGSDAKICGRASAPTEANAAGSGAVIGRVCQAVLADALLALREANARLCGSGGWYDGVRKRYSTSPLRTR